jgi:hypothetical protein
MSSRISGGGEGGGEGGGGMGGGGVGGGGVGVGGDGGGGAGGGGVGGGRGGGLGGLKHVTSKLKTSDWLVSNASTVIASPRTQPLTLICTRDNQYTPPVTWPAPITPSSAGRELIAATQVPVDVVTLP